MAKLNVEQVRKLAREMAMGSPGGLRYNVLVRKIKDKPAETPINTIDGSFLDLANRFPIEIMKRSRGLLMPVSAWDGESRLESEKNRKAPRVNEEDFYAPIAD